jgi:DNA-binding MarR family transcriptional regulator
MSPPKSVPETATETANRLHRSALEMLRVLRAGRPGKGLTVSGLGVLDHLHREGMTTATALAAHLHVQPQSLTRLLADLERRKLIVRRRSDTDRRQSILEITDTGVRLLTESMGERREELARTMAAELTPAEQELLRIAAGLMDRLATVTVARAKVPRKPGPDCTPERR